MPFIGLGLNALVPLIAGAAILGALGGLYGYVYNRGADAAEVDNLRSIITETHAAEVRTKAAYEKVNSDLQDEQEAVKSLHDLIDVISDAPPSTDEAGICDLDAKLPWSNDS